MSVGRQETFEVAHNESAFLAVMFDCLPLEQVHLQGNGPFLPVRPTRVFLLSERLGILREAFADAIMPPQLRVRSA